MTDMPDALDGIRVLDLSRLVAGGMTGMVLADFGADVVKVEQPGQGDPLRTWTSEGRPHWWRVYGRNKRCITLNLRHEEGKELFRQLLPRFDVLIESFVPGTLERWGMAWETLRAWRPGLILVQISGWGQDGPYRERPGFGTLVEAASGFAAMNGEPSGPPVVPPFPLADMAAGLYAVSAILAALRHRDRTGGEGQRIDVSLFEPLFSLLGPLAADYAASGRVRTRTGSRSSNSAPRGVYRTRDGEWLAVSASTPKMAETFLRAYGLGHLLEDPRFATNEARVRNGAALDAAVEEAIGSRTLAENRAVIEAHGLTAVPVQTIADIEADPHWRARGLTLDATDEAGTVRTQNVVPRLEATPGRVRWPGRPTMGSDNEAVYGGELGLTADDIARLCAEGVL
jgi:formyl-CoA transferase